MSENKFTLNENAWCPGCGNHIILDCLKTALEEMGKTPYEILMVGGIGQAAKTPQYISANCFCGLHGRSLPAAIAAKIANENLTVIVDTGDGDSYGEGGNHFIHNIRRNVNISHFVHDNQIYALTKGQASPTSLEGNGNLNSSFNPILMAIAAGAGFVARAFTGHKEQLVEIMKQAIEYDGYALVDILQPCVSFNKTNTFEWYNKRVYDLDESYDSKNKLKSIEKAMEFDDKIPLGIIYQENKTSYHKKNNVLKNGEPLLDIELNHDVIKSLIAEFI